MGLVTMISVAVSEITFAGVVPKRTAVAFARLVPKMSTVVPPESGPEEGLIEVTTGVSDGGTVVVVVEVVGGTVVVVVDVTVVVVGATVVVVVGVGVGGRTGRAASKMVRDILVEYLPFFTSSVR